MARQAKDSDNFCRLNAMTSRFMSIGRRDRDCGNPDRQQAIYSSREFCRNPRQPAFEPPMKRRGDGGGNVSLIINGVQRRKWLDEVEMDRWLWRFPRVSAIPW